MKRVVAFLLSLTLVGCSSPVLVGSPTTTTTSSTTSTSTTTSTTTTTTLPPSTAEGAVFDADGRPVARARVEFGDVEMDTDEHGAFFLSTRQPGPIRVSKAGWIQVELDWPGEDPLELVLEPLVVRALRVGGGAAGSEAHFRHLLDLAADSAVNALVFDTKQEGGAVVYGTSVPEAHRIGAVDARYDPLARIGEARAAGLYTITRIVVFEDRFWVAAHPGERLAGRWVDPTAPQARRYNLDLAVEACELGFDEVQFDYVRYPTGETGRVSGHRSLPQEVRVEAIASFLEQARSELAPLGCSVSADIFGIVVSTQNDQGIGQRPEELSMHLDAISPMVYPSHYSDGWLGLADPNDHPYRVVANAIDAALPRVEKGVLRPWLQAFWWTNAQIRESIQAAEDRGVGWMLWNSGSTFEREALPAADEVGH